MSEFKKIGLEENLILAVEKMGFETPSEVQSKTVPILLEKDTDLVALAQTGTGKTAAFGFPMIQKIDINSKKTQGLILSPTRELCLQITNELKQYGQFYKGLNITAIYGGAIMSWSLERIVFCKGFSQPRTAVYSPIVELKIEIIFLFFGILEGRRSYF